MKKTVILVVAAMLVVASLVSGVFALYKSDLDNVTGDVLAKQFVLTGTGADSFGQAVKIAPSETKTSQFTVSNYENDKISEVDINVTITVEFNSEIAPLTIELKNKATGEVVIATDSVDKTYAFTMAASAGAKTETFEITVSWPAGDQSGSDNAYIGKTASFIVKVSGVQAI